MNLSAASGMLPVNKRLNGAPRLTYLPRPLKRRWRSPRTTLRALVRLWRSRVA